jgi:hypothetical protein
VHWRQVAEQFIGERWRDRQRPNSSGAFGEELVAVTAPFDDTGTRPRVKTRVL